jgi:hypothetical protein
MGLRIIAGVTAAAALVLGSAAIAAQDDRAPVYPTGAKPGDPDTLCKFVADTTAHSKPYQMCLRRSEWAQKAALDAKDPNRIECHYEETPGTRVRNRKICQPASEWAEQRRLAREHVEEIQMKTCQGQGPC